MSFGQIPPNFSQELHISDLTQFREDHSWEHKDGLSEDDRHYTSVIDAQRHKRTAPRIDLTANSALGVLDGDLPLGLRYRNDPGNHSRKEQHKPDRMEKIKL